MPGLFLDMLIGSVYRICQNPVGPPGYKVTGTPSIPVCFQGPIPITLEAFHYVILKNIEIKDTLFLQKQVLRTF